MWSHLKPDHLYVFACARIADRASHINTGAARAWKNMFDANPASQFEWAHRGFLLLLRGCFPNQLSATRSRSRSRSFAIER